MAPQHRVWLPTSRVKPCYIFALAPVPAPRQADILECLTLFFHKYYLLVIDVYQAWCGPCKAMQALFRKVKNELNEDEILHFVVVRISFLLNCCFFVTLSIEVFSLMMVLI